MIDFGFALKETRQENLDKTSLEKFYRLQELVPSFKRCFQCGNCSATCSARQFTDFSIRRVHTSFRRGEYDGLAEELRNIFKVTGGMDFHDAILNGKKDD